MSKLSQYLRKRGIRQTDFAEQLATNQATISRIANGKHPGLTLALAKKIEDATQGQVPAMSLLPIADTPPERADQ